MPASSSSSSSSASLSLPLSSYRTPHSSSSSSSRYNNSHTVSSNNNNNSATTTVEKEEKATTTTTSSSQQQLKQVDVELALESSNLVKHYLELDESSSDAACRRSVAQQQTSSSQVSLLDDYMRHLFDPYAFRLQPAGESFSLQSSAASTWSSSSASPMLTAYEAHTAASESRRRRVQQRHAERTTRRRLVALGLTLVGGDKKSNKEKKSKGEQEENENDDDDEDDDEEKEAESLVKSFTSHKAFAQVFSSTTSEVERVVASSDCLHLLDSLLHELSRPSCVKAYRLFDALFARDDAVSARLDTLVHIVVHVLSTWSSSKEQEQRSKTNDADDDNDDDNSSSRPAKRIKLDPQQQTKETTTTSSSSSSKANKTNAPLVRVRTLKLALDYANLLLTAYDERVAMRLVTTSGLGGSRGRSLQELLVELAVSSSVAAESLRLRCVACLDNSLWFGACAAHFNSGGGDARRRLAAELDKTPPVRHGARLLLALTSVLQKADFHANLATFATTCHQLFVDKHANSKQQQQQRGMTISNR